MAPADWGQARLGERVRLVRGVAYKGAQLGKPGPRLLGLGAIRPGGGIKLDDAREYGGRIRDWERIQPGELVIALTDITQDGRVLGTPGLVPSTAEGEYAVSLDLARVEIGDPKGVDVGFLYYLLQSYPAHAYMRGVATGTTVRRVSIADVEAYTAPFPPLAEQRLIARVLGDLDDRINLNGRMGETLEAPARALFRSWFVDLDPVHAKAASVDSGLPDEVIEYFPASFSDSGVGTIPAGWETRPVGDLAAVVGGTTPRTDEPAFWVNGTHHWATPKDLASLQTPVLLDTARRITDAGLSRIGSGLLPPGTVLLSSRAPIGYLAVTEVPVAINQGFIAMIPKPGISNLFLLHWARHSHDAIVSHANGSTFLEISKANFRPLPVVTPPQPVLRAFDALAQPMHARMVACERESMTLAALRDALLPKLISGELRVPDAECIAVEAGA